MHRELAIGPRLIGLGHRPSLFCAIELGTYEAVTEQCQKFFYPFAACRGSAFPSARLDFGEEETQSNPPDSKAHRLTPTPVVPKGFLVQDPVHTYKQT